MSAAEIRKQIEYYLGDLNLARDDFFRDVITKTEGGYVDITNFLNCNKVKKMNVNAEAIAAAVEDSTAVELSKDKKSVRRANNKALPEKTGNMKKREQKAAEKEEEKTEATQEDPFAGINTWFSAEKLTNAYQAIDTPHACTTLAVGAALERPDLLTTAHEALQKEEFFFTQLSIGAHVLCRPFLFRKAFELAVDPQEKSDWLIFEAHGMLGQHQIAKAQKILKQVESFEQTTSQVCVFWG